MLAWTERSRKYDEMVYLKWTYRKKLNFESGARVATEFRRTVKSSKSLGRGQRQNGRNFDSKSAASKLCFWFSFWRISPTPVIEKTLIISRFMSPRDDVSKIRIPLI